MESKFHLFNQGDGNSDPLPEEDEETDDDEEDDADHRGEREPSISLLQEIVHYFWSPVQLNMLVWKVKVRQGTSTLNIRIDICCLILSLIKIFKLNQIINKWWGGNSV